MARKPIQTLPFFRRLSLPILQQMCKFLEHSAGDLPYLEGAHLTQSAIDDMKIVFDEKALNDFWKPADPKSKRALQGALDIIFSSQEDMLNEASVCKKSLDETPCPTIGDGYMASRLYSRLLDYLLVDGLFYNEMLADSSGGRLFRSLGVGFYRTHIHIETCEAFSTPGYPHISVLSIQPQRASSPKELLCTEFWTLFYWSQRLVRRAICTTDFCLPIRMISLSGYEARVVSAVFSLAYPRKVKSDGENIKYQDKYHGVQCRIHIAEYRDLSVRQNLQDLMEESIATPCGNTNEQQNPSINRNV